MTNAAVVIRELKKRANRKIATGMAWYGITSKRVLGVSAPVLRGMAGQSGKNHSLAGELWRTGVLGC